MEINYNNKRFLSADLMDVLLKFYSAQEIRDICFQWIYPFLQKSPPNRKQKKNELVHTLHEVLTDPMLAREFLAFLPENLSKALTLLAWEGDCEIGVIEEQLGYSISRKTKRAHPWRQRETLTEVHRLPEFLFIALEKENYSYSYSQQQEQVNVKLPSAIRQMVFNALPEKPEGYEIDFLDSPDIGSAHRFCCRSHMVEDIQRISAFIEKGHLVLTKRGIPTKASLRQVSGFCGDREFFPNTDVRNHPRLELLRSYLLTQLLKRMPSGLRVDLASNRVRPSSLRKILDWVEDHPEWVFEHLLGHLSSRYDVPFIENDHWLEFQEFIRNLRGDGWVTMENLRRYHRYRGLDFRFTRGHYITARLSSESVYSWNRYGQSKVDLREDTSSDLFEIPLIQGFCFLLAAIGFAEIAYRAPSKHPRCPSHNSDFLTPFDGLNAVRLTPEGSYALGFDETIELKKPEDPRTRIVLNPNCLNAICHEVDPVTELSLLDFMEKISPGHYRMTRTSFLGDSKNKSDAQKRLAGFHLSISEELPALWKTFLEETVRTCVALKPIKGFRLFELDNDPEFRNRFISDPFLRTHCLKAEGFKLLIENSKVAAVQKHLKKLGYILQ